jgi:4-hydroxy-tetrahydrodipicolinate synthase
MFTGCGTALVTPFRADLSIDEAAMRMLVRRQIDAGIDFLVPCGTTGESPTLTREEHLRVVEITIKESAGKVPVLAGAGGYNTREVIEIARAVEKLGADGILSVTPYYNKPTQEGLYEHYKIIAESIGIPVVVYSVQGRTGVNVEPVTLKRLAEIENIVGVKEASGNISQIASVIHHVPDEFVVLSGDDVLTIPLMALGGHGVISVASNEIPAEMTAIAHFCAEGNYERARATQRHWMSVLTMNFLESNPIPVKAAMAAMGLLELNYRLPMVPPSEATSSRINAILNQTGLRTERFARSN